MSCLSNPSYNKQLDSDPTTNDDAECSLKIARNAYFQPTTQWLFLADAKSSCEEVAGP